jgi:hypothetical protein
VQQHAATLTRGVKTRDIVAASFRCSRWSSNCLTAK